MESSKLYIQENEELRIMGFSYCEKYDDYDADTVDGKLVVKLNLCQDHVMLSLPYNIKRLADLMIAQRDPILNKIDFGKSLGFELAGIKCDRYHNPFLRSVTFQYYIVFYRKDD